jgi:hypothetical protein
MIARSPRVWLIDIREEIAGIQADPGQRRRAVLFKNRAARLLGGQKRKAG